MRLNADFTQRVVVRPDDYSWSVSPSGGVERMMLDRIGDEVARATTIVRFAPGSSFDAHTHGGGEEFLVLEGVFSDETGDFPKGSYVRNPIGTHHKPHTDAGCTILVKLHQFAPDDTAQVHVGTADVPFSDGDHAGTTMLPLHAVEGEEVSLVRISPGAVFKLGEGAGGAEIFVLEGTASDFSGSLPQGSWVRVPDGEALELGTDAGCLIWVKCGHLKEVIGVEVA